MMFTSYQDMGRSPKSLLNITRFRPEKGQYVPKQWQQFYLNSTVCYGVIKSEQG
jgi:hypothetical protein